jgi:hypothetical protein
VATMPESAPEKTEEVVALVPAAYTPGPDEWQLIERQAKRIAGTALVPAVYRNKPDEIIAVALTAREVGIGMMQALRHIYIVDGKPSMSAELMVSLVRKRGHSISGVATDKKATVIGRRRDTGDTVTVEWVIDMARRAKLLTKTNWQSYPESMLWARAVSQVCRMLFSDCTGGIGYMPEELEGLSEGALPPEGRVVEQTSPAQDRDAIQEAQEGEVIDPPALNPQYLTQGARDALKEACGGTEATREWLPKVYEALGVYDDDTKRWVPWSGEVKFGFLTVAHRDWIMARLNADPDDQVDA